MTQIKGSITALITPFRNGAVDDDAFQKLVERQIAAGTHGLVPVGTTGESATLTPEEHERVVIMCIEVAAGRVPVIGGAGSNETSFSISMAQRLQKTGADAILSVTGYYNRPSQAGLVAHYTALHDATDIPIILYNVPARTAVNVSRETMATLSRLPRIFGVKDATGDLARVALTRAECDKDFVQISGEDMTAVGFNAMGGVGCISVASNVAPELCSHMQEACLSDDYVTARALQDRLALLNDGLFADASPAPTKYAMELMGLCSAETRLPIVEASDAAKKKVKTALSELGLI